jgi:hypothetical protein
MPWRSSGRSSKHAQPTVCLQSHAKGRVIALGEFLTQLTTLETLSISGVDMAWDIIESLQFLEQMPHLKALEVERAYLEGTPIVQELGQILSKVTGLTSLEFLHSSVYAQDVHVLLGCLSELRALQNFSLECDCRYRDCGEYIGLLGQLLASMSCLRSLKLAYMDLKDNSIGQWLVQMTALKSLCLNHCELKWRSNQLVEQLAQLPSLTRLHLNGNKLDDMDARAICESLECMSAMRELSLSDNRFDFECTAVLGRSLACMTGNRWGADGECKLMRHLVGLPHLKRVGLSDDVKAWTVRRQPTVRDTLGRLQSVFADKHAEAMDLSLMRNLALNEDQHKNCS